jgi:hypothetical protein
LKPKKKIMRSTLVFIITIIVICVTISAGCISGDVSGERVPSSPTYSYSGQSTPASSCILGSYQVTINDPLGMGIQNIRSYSKTSNTITVVYSDGTLYAKTSNTVSIIKGSNSFARAGETVSITGNGNIYAPYA